MVNIDQYCFELKLRRMFLSTQYYGVMFYFGTWSGRDNLLSDTDVACVAIALAPCLTF